MGKVIKFSATFDNVNVRQNGTAVARFKAPYSEVASYIQLVTVLAKDLQCKLTARKEKVSFGSVFVKQMAIDQDGEAKIQFVIDTGSADITWLMDKREDNITIALKEEEGESSDEQ